MSVHVTLPSIKSPAAHVHRVQDVQSAGSSCTHSTLMSLHLWQCEIPEAACTASTQHDELLNAGAHFKSVCSWWRFGMSHL